MKETSFCSRDWVGLASQFGEKSITAFANNVNELLIDPKYISGNVLVAGPGKEFPERLLIFAPDSNFTSLNPQINSLTCCEPDLFCPRMHLDQSVEILKEGEVPRFDSGKFYYLPTHIETMLDSTPEAFDAITLFRMPQIQKLLENGLLPLIANSLKQDGIFMGSGYFSSLKKAEEILIDQFTPEAISKLNNPNSSGNSYGLENIGFVMRKN